MIDAPERGSMIDAPERGSMIDAVVRFDLEQDGGGRRGLAAAFAECVARICAAEGAAEVLAVIIDDRARAPRRTRKRGGGGWGTLIAAFARRLAQDEVTLEGAWAVRAIQARQPWWSLLDADQQGTLPDPAASMVTVAHVLDGRPIRGARSELTDLVVPDQDSADEGDGAPRAGAGRRTRAVRGGHPAR